MVFKPADPVADGRILSLGGENDPPSPPLKKGGTGSEVPLFQGGFRGIELELEATPPTLKYARCRSRLS